MAHTGTCPGLEKSLSLRRVREVIVKFTVKLKWNSVLLGPLTYFLLSNFANWQQRLIYGTFSPFFMIQKEVTVKNKESIVKIKEKLG
jgi:hypothetical protein